MRRMTATWLILALTGCSISIQQRPDTAPKQSAAQVKAAPEPKAEPKVEPKAAAAKPKPKAEPKPEPKAEAKPAPKPAPKPSAPASIAAGEPAPGAASAPSQSDDRLPPSAAVPAKRPASDESRIVVPVRVPFEAAIAKIDALVEKKAHGDWKTVSKGDDSPKVDVKYDVWRDRPIQAEWKDDALRVTVPVKYAADVRAQLRNPLDKDGWTWVTKGESWGTKAEPQELLATFEAKVAITDDLHVRVDAKLESLKHGKAPSGEVCIKALAKLCVSKESLTPMVRRHIDDYLKPRLTKALAQSGAQLDGALQLAKRTRALWDALQKPLPLQKVAQKSCPTELGASCKQAAWLVLQPTSLALVGPRMDGKDLRVDVGITGKIAVWQGDAPKLDALALPKLSKPGPDGFRVRVELHLTSPELAAKLDERMARERFAAQAETLQNATLAALNSALKNKLVVSGKLNELTIESLEKSEAGVDASAVLSGELAASLSP